jgi:fructose-1-phosphate kinase PfkB-like protein
MQLGGKAIHLTQNSPDETVFSSLCLRDGIDLRTVLCEHPPRTCVTLVDFTSKTSTEVVEEGPRVDEDVELNVIKEFSTLQECSHTVIISGSTAVGFSPDVFAKLVKISALHCNVVLDFRGPQLVRALEAYKELTSKKKESLTAKKLLLIAKPNFDEFLSTFLEQTVKDLPFQEQVDLVKVKLIELKRLFFADFVITNGTRPTLYTTPDFCVREVPVAPAGIYKTYKVIHSHL